MFSTKYVHFRAVTTSMESKMLFHRDVYTTLFLVLICKLNPVDACRHPVGILTRYNHNTEIELNITAPGLTITVNDTAKGVFCRFGSFDCYIECSYQNFFENESNTSQHIYVKTKFERATAVEFNISSADANISSCSVIACLNNETSHLLKTKEQRLKIPHDLFRIPIIKKMCSDAINYVDYTRVEKKAIDSVINMTSKSHVFSGESLALSVVKMDLNTTNKTIPVNAPLVFSLTTQIQIWIPVEAFQKFSKDQNTIGIVTYVSDEQFIKNETAVSKVIRIEVPGQSIANLANRLKIHFPLTNPNNKTFHCQFYDEKDNTWKSTGCETKLMDSSVECLCDHMTPFAVLLTEMNIDTQNWKVLSVISYIGCSLSAFFCGCSILSYIVDSKAGKEVSRSIHVSLSAALFLLNITFMLSEWAATLNENVCVFVAVAIHYGLLCSFTWMAIEGLHLYILLVRVFNIYIKHYMAKLSLIGWGVPAVVVGGLLISFSTTPFYGSQRMTLSDSSASNQICWIKNRVVLYAVNISYLILMFLFNTVILITVSKKVFLLRKIDRTQRKMPAYKDVGMVVGLMCLLGTTWGLAFFTSGYTNYPVLYLFCILNSMQGFYIFIWMCGTAKKNRTELHNDQTVSTSVTSK